MVWPSISQLNEPRRVFSLRVTTAASCKSELRHELGRISGFEMQMTLDDLWIIARSGTDDVYTQISKFEKAIRQTDPQCFGRLALACFSNVSGQARAHHPSHDLLAVSQLLRGLAVLVEAV